MFSKEMDHRENVAMQCYCSSFAILLQCCIKLLQYFFLILLQYYYNVVAVFLRYYCSTINTIAVVSRCYCVPVGAGWPQTRSPSNLNIGRYLAPVGEKRKWDRCS